MALMPLPLVERKLSETEFPALSAKASLDTDTDICPSHHQAAAPCPFASLPVCQPSTPLPGCAHCSTQQTCLDTGYFLPPLAGCSQTQASVR